MENIFDFNLEYLSFLFYVDELGEILEHQKPSTEGQIRPIQQKFKKPKFKVFWDRFPRK